MASSLSGQDEPRCSKLPGSARWRYVARAGLPAVSRKKIVFFFHVINPVLTKLVRLRWLYIGLVLFFCVFMDRNSVSVHKPGTQKELGQYPANLTSRFVNNLHLLFRYSRGNGSGEGGLGSVPQEFKIRDLSAFWHHLTRRTTFIFCGFYWQRED